MSQLVPWFLFAHVFGAIIAFGPSFSMSIIGGMGGKEPMHANFASRVAEAISKQRILPLAIVQGITGVGLIITANIDLLNTRWLLSGIVLYAIALGYAIGVQTPAVHRLIELTSGGPPAGAIPASGAPAGPPPEVLAAVRKVQRGGMILGLLITAIAFLMVVKPTI
jgi:uncharacterized membrane protein